MLSVIRDVEDAARRPKILHASMGEGYPWADVPEMGAAFYAVADGDVQAAADAARWMAQRGVGTPKRPGHGASAVGPAGGVPCDEGGDWADGDA